VTVTARDYEALWRGARACAWLADDLSDKHERERFAHHGIGYAKAAAALEPKRVEGNYYLGINIGLWATTMTIGAYNLVPKIRDAALAAASADRNYDHGGPLRLLGSVYAKAPPWPASIGDLEDGLKYLGQAVELGRDYPHNHLLYGQALAADDQLEKAAAQLRCVVDAAPVAAWSHRLDRWRKEATDDLRKLAQKGVTDAPSACR
jgi:hypothetical protein